MSTLRDWEMQWNWARIQSRRKKKTTGSNRLGLRKEQLHLGQEAMCVKCQYRKEVPQKHLENCLATEVARQGF